MICAGILAGGTGSRMGASVPKQFLEIRGVPVLVRTVDAFVRPECFDRIYVAVTSGWEDYARELISGHFGGSGSIEVITGGSDRTGSILKVIEAIDKLPDGTGADTDDILLATHDAARPFVTADMIRENIRAAREHGCAGTAVPAQDTVFMSSDGTVIYDIPPRGVMYQMQTPQTFRIGLFRQALASLDDKQRSEVTDVCGVFVRAGMKTCFSRGDRRNIKITEPLDIALAESITDQG